MGKAVHLHPLCLLPRQCRRGDCTAGYPNAMEVGVWKRNADTGERGLGSMLGQGWGHASRLNGPLVVRCGNRVKVVLGQALEVVEPVGVEVETWVSTKPFVPIFELEDPASVPHALPELD
jgi:hypothetical protein